MQLYCVVMYDVKKRKIPRKIEKNRNTKKYSTCGDSEEKKKKYQTNYIIVLYEGSTPSRGKQYDGADVSQLQAVRAVAVKGALRQGAPRRPRH